MLIIPGILASSYPVATTSYESIATVTVGAGGSSSISFTSIPSTYKHLQIRAIARDTTAAPNISIIRYNLNGDTSANYSAHFLRGNGSSADALGYSSQTYSWLYYFPYNSVTSNVMGALILDIHDYASTTKNKTIRALSGTDANGDGGIALNSGLWLSTNAVNSITFTANGTAFTSSTTFALYGIKG